MDANIERNSKPGAFSPPIKTTEELDYNIKFYACYYAKQITLILQRIITHNATLSFTNNKQY